MSGKPTVTSPQIREQIEAAEHALLAATVALGEALVVQQAVPDRDVSGEQAAVDEARQRVGHLKLILPLVERAEAEALAITRAQLAAEQRKGLEKALRELTKHAVSLSVHYQNMESAWRRLTRAGETASHLLFEHQKCQGHGIFLNRLSAAGLRALADQEVNRLGLRPALQGGVSAPGTNHAIVPTNLSDAPHLLPSLEAEIRRLAVVLLETAPTPQESEDAPVAGKPQSAPTASAEASAREVAQ